MLLAAVEDYDGGELLNIVCWVCLMKLSLLMRNEKGLTGVYEEGGGVNVTFNPLSFYPLSAFLTLLNLKKLLPYYLLLFTLMINLTLTIHICRHIDT